jgi:hypothetical protein
MTPTLTPSAESTLSAGDRCDRCGAAAKVRAVLPGGGELVFCGHHAHKYADNLEKVAIAITWSDETEKTDD